MSVIRYVGNKEMQLFCLIWRVSNIENIGILYKKALHEIYIYRMAQKESNIYDH